MTTLTRWEQVQQGMQFIGLDMPEEEQGKLWRMIPQKRKLLGEHLYRPEILHVRHDQNGKGCSVLFDVTEKIYLMADKHFAKGACNVIFRGICYTSLQRLAIRVALRRGAVTENELEGVSITKGKPGFVHTLRFVSVTEHSRYIPRMVMIQELWDGTLTDVVEERMKLPFKAQMLASGLHVAENQRIFSRVMQGLSYLHNLGWVHGDVKELNILVRRVPETGEVVDAALTDLGSCAKVGDGGRIRGTIGYLPPQVLREKKEKVSASWDHFALGVVLFTAYSLKFHRRKLEAIQSSGERGVRMDEGRVAPGAKLKGSIAELCEHLVTKPGEAPFETMDQVLSHFMQAMQNSEEAFLKGDLLGSRRYIVIDPAPLKRHSIL